MNLFNPYIAMKLRVCRLSVRNGPTVDFLVCLLHGVRPFCKLLPLIISDFSTFDFSSSGYVFRPVTAGGHLPRVLSLNMVTILRLTETGEPEIK